MCDEYYALIKNNPWTLVPRPADVNIVRSMWLFWHKYLADGRLGRYKARVVANGNTQLSRIDVDESFSPVVKSATIQTVLSLVVSRHWLVHQLDPPGFQDPEFLARVYKVEKAMYGLHQAPRAWYVLQKKDGIFLSQDKYAGDILKKFGYSDVRSANTPIDKENPWGKDRTGKDVDLHLYRSMIGSLMYLTASRPDIMFAICACARHQVTPKECHLHAVKRIFRYLKGHPKLGLWYPKESPFDLVAYSDSDYGGATQDRKSTTGGCQFLVRRLIAWQCKKQTIVATSTTEAEYVAAASSCGIQNQLLDYGHYFIRDCFEKKLICVDHIHTDDNVGDLLTKPFDAGRLAFCDYHNKIAILEKYEHNVDFHQIVDFVEASHIRTIFESSIKRNLKLNDEEGISSLPDAELFENLALMGYNILPNQKFTFQKDEHASLVRDNSQGKAFPTISGLEAGQDRENIIKTSALPHDSTPRVTSLAADEGTQDLEISNLKARIKLLKDKDKGTTELSGDDALIKGRSLETGEEVGVKKSTERGSNDIDELVNVLTSMDAATILTSGVQAVSVPPVTEIPTVGIPTGSGMVPTVSHIFTTASVVTPYSGRKGKEKTVESDTLKKKKLQEQIDVHVAREIEEQMAREDQRRNEQIARDAEIARIHAEEELQMLIDGLDRNNEVIANHLQEYEQFATDLSIGEKIDLINELVKYQDHYAKVLNYQAQQSKPLSKKQQREFYMSVLKSHSEEGEIMKKKGLRLEQESAKKMKTSEERNYWKIIRLGGSTTVYQFFVDMLKYIDREDLNQLWTLVKETLSIRQATSDKEKELWVKLKRNKMLKSFPLPMIKFSLPEYFPTTSEEMFPLLSQREATAKEVCTAEKLKAQVEEIGRLKERVQVLEDREAVAIKQSGEDAPIKGRSNNEGEAASERIKAQWG
nr:putative ribonuclease H-like domain-containing protein [Tanacetum cinerariifolium]